MKILAIKRSSQGTGLKVYGKIQGDSLNNQGKPKVYKFAYFRRPNFRGWLCSCENFLLSKFAKHRNCKHLHQVRSQYGRYGSLVPKS